MRGIWLTTKQNGTMMSHMDGSRNGNASILQKALRVWQSSDVGVAAQAVLRNFLKRWKMIC